MPADRFSQRIKAALAVHANIVSGSSSDSEDDLLATNNGDKLDNMSNRLQELLDLQKHLSEESDSSDEEHLLANNPQLMTLFRQRQRSMDNNDMLRALGQIISNSDGKHISENDPTQSSEEETSDSIHTPTEEHPSNTEDEFVPSSPEI